MVVADPCHRIQRVVSHRAWFNNDARQKRQDVVSHDQILQQHEEANRTVKAMRYFTEQDDGLKRSWYYGRVFLNPPGGLVDEFWKKTLAELNSAETRQK